MISVGSNAFVLTPSGPVHLDEAAEGMEVLALQGGKQALVRIKECRAVKADQAGVRLCTSIGDLALAPTTSVVTSSGTIQAGALLEQRDQSALGRMEGSWSPVEALSQAGRRPPSWLSIAQAWPNLRTQVLAAGAVNWGPKQGTRVGAQPNDGLRDFATWVIGRPSAELVDGRAGWAWFMGAATPSKVRQEAPSVDLAVSCLLRLWQWVEDRRYVLPIECEAVRALTIAWLQWLSIPYSIDFKPHYLPADAFIEMNVSARTHLPIQAVLSSTPRIAVRLVMQARSCYPVVNGILCAE